MTRAVNEHADIGPGTTHHGTPDECGCWPRLASRLKMERDDARAAHKAEYERAEALTVAVADVAQERDVARAELAAYRGEKWSPEHGGSEVDRLKAIIGELDAQKKKALIERNEAHAKVAGLVNELSLAGRRRDGEPDAMDFMPVASAYADEYISGGKLRELLRLWLRGASCEELVSLLPPDDAPQF